ncbi:hypothetical protein PENTCL1PPCAC_11589 [Pristionchus entomophagus]|uniref:Exosome complex component RRP45 n=1 Tax=Pristionchus entomophagus TaxID=358040 RepID=A0AAV5T6W7_9BILA|nr:hypothetical protein PENTCL1PPCAC_11589 [Pristionchus entomophagus]
MRTDPPSLTERQFVLDGIREGVRTDERGLEDFRQALLVLGKQPGSALCTIGNTKVMCAVSASITQPTRSRPHKGIISVEVDMSPMASPAHEANRLGNKGLELTRLLEMLLRDSRCIDVESLCIRAKKEVWKMRVDVRVLDDDGSLVDCASLAAATALQHYSRPDVTVLPECTKIHSEYDKMLVPLSIYHMPICVTFGISTDLRSTIVDPTERESHYLDGALIIGCNRRREVCVLHQSNHLVLSTSQITACVKRAMDRVGNLSDLVSTVIADEARRMNMKEEGSGFETAITAELLTCKEWSPNELVAPAVKITTTVAPEVKEEPIVMEENALREGAIEMDEEDRKGLEEQVQAIASNVNTVEINSKPKKSAKQKDNEAAHSLLDDLDGFDDLDGETMELEGEMNGDSFDLAATKKKKQKK